MNTRTHKKRVIFLMKGNKSSSQIRPIPRENNGPFVAQRSFQTIDYKWFRFPFLCSTGLKQYSLIDFLIWVYLSQSSRKFSTRQTNRTLKGNTTPFRRHRSTTNPNSLSQKPTVNLDEKTVKDCRLIRSSIKEISFFLKQSFQLTTSVAGSDGGFQRYHQQ